MAPGRDSNATGIDDLLQHRLTRRQALKQLTAAGVLLSSPAALASCGGSSAPPKANVDQLNWALTVVRTLDSPRASFDADSQTASTLALEPLLTYDDNLKLVGALAQSWKAADRLTYVYQLRPGVKFWDGSPVTPEDVAFSVSRHLDPKLGSSLNSYMGAVKSVTVTGKSEITVKLGHPDPFWKYIPTFTVVVPKQLAQRAGKDFGAPGPHLAIMGTGPYKPTAFSADDKVTYVRNDAYWGAKPTFKRIAISIIPDPNTRQLAMRSGSIDGTLNISPATANSWKRISGISVNSAPGLAVSFFSFDLSQKPWDDIHVRRAVAHAVDRQGLVKSLLHGLAEPASSIVPRQMWFGLVPPARVASIYQGLPSYAFDLAMAKRELSQSSVPGGFSASVSVRTSRPDLVQAAVSLSNNLKTLGIDLKVNSQPLDQEIAEVTAHKDLGFRLAAFGPDYPDPGDYPAFMFPSADARPNAFNLANWKNKQVDSLLNAQAQAAEDPEKRAQAIAEIMKLAAVELPYLPLWWEDTVMAIQHKLSYEKLNALYPRQDWIQHVKPAA